MAKITTKLIADEPNSYEAFLYRWTNLTNGRIYIGYHTGFVGDGYNHSGECSDLNDDFQNESHEWQYEVLEYGTTNEMKNAERDLLKSVEARRNRHVYYNQTNGGAAYKHTNKIIRRSLIKSILDGEYLAKDEYGEPLKIKKDEFQELLDNRIQVRGQDNSDGVKHISDEIDEDGGTQNCNPITLLEDFFGKGKHRLLDGSTTMVGTMSSKHGLYLKYNLVPYDVYSKFNEYDLREVGFILNPKQKNKKWESDDKDLIDHIMQGYQLYNLPIKSKENREFLKETGCNGNKISYIFNKCEKLKAFGIYKAKGTPWIIYKLPQNKPKLKQRAEEIRNSIPSTEVFEFSSEKYRWEDIAMHLVDNNKSKKKMINISVIIHYPHPNSEKVWNKRLAKVQSYMDGLTSQFGVKFLGFEYMPKY